MKTEPNDLLGTSDGLTKREYFAAMAMQGMCVFGAENISKDAELAVKMADALITQLNKPLNDK